MSYFLCNYKGCLHPLEDFDTCTVGRNRKNNVRILDTRTSRYHALIEIDRNTVTVEDLHTENGTFIFDEKIRSGEKFALNVGDLIGFGSSAVIDALNTLRLETIPDSGSVLSDQVESDPTTNDEISSDSQNSEFMGFSADLGLEENVIENKEDLGSVSTDRVESDPSTDDEVSSDSQNSEFMGFSADLGQEENVIENKNHSPK